MLYFTQEIIKCKESPCPIFHSMLTDEMGKITVILFVTHERRILMLYLSAKRYVGRLNNITVEKMINPCFQLMRWKYALGKKCALVKYYIYDKTDDCFFELSK